MALDDQTPFSTFADDHQGMQPDEVYHWSPSIGAQGYPFCTKHSCLMCIFQWPDQFYKTQTTAKWSKINSHVSGLAYL